MKYNPIDNENEFLEKMVKSYSETHNERYWKEVTPFIKDKASGKILDLGCGPGLLLRDLDLKYSPKLIYGLDRLEVMLNRTKEILNEAVKQNRVKLILQNIQEDSSLPSDLDIIFSSRVLRSFEDQWEILSSIYYSLNQGGLLVLLDWAKEDIETYYNWFKSNGSYDGNISEVIKRHRNFSRYNLNDWHFMLKNVGLKMIHSFQLDPVHLGLIAMKE